jgi:hypothetical protein
MPFVTLPTEPGGPIIDVTIGVSHPRELQLRQFQEVVPVPLKLRALIDTGASCSLVTQNVVRWLHLPVRGVTPLRTPSTGETPHEASVYEVSLAISLSDDQFRRYGVVPVIAHNSVIQPGVEALLGRDILQHALFTYNGAGKTFLLGF